LPIEQDNIPDGGRSDLIEVELSFANAMQQFDAMKSWSQHSCNLVFCRRFIPP
jgi:hypothetical protein